MNKPSDIEIVNILRHYDWEKREFTSEKEFEFAWNICEILFDKERRNVITSSDFLKLIKIPVVVNELSI